MESYAKQSEFLAQNGIYGTARQRMTVALFRYAARGNPALPPYERKAWIAHFIAGLAGSPEWDDLISYLNTEVVSLSSYSLPPSVVEAAAAFEARHSDCPKLIGSNRANAQDAGGRLMVALGKVAKEYFRPYGDMETWETWLGMALAWHLMHGIGLWREPAYEKEWAWRLRTLPEYITLPSVLSGWNEGEDIDLSHYADAETLTVHYTLRMGHAPSEADAAVIARTDNTNIYGPSALLIAELKANRSCPTTQRVIAWLLENREALIPIEA